MVEAHDFKTMDIENIWTPYKFGVDNIIIYKGLERWIRSRTMHDYFNTSALVRMLPLDIELLLNYRLVQRYHLAPPDLKLGFLISLLPLLVVFN